jgi:alkyl sulfatase BDS1-like metallo-beta-lactamase superfamily hydrolase
MIAGPRTAVQAYLGQGLGVARRGEYMLAQEILNKLVHAEPDKQEAKDLLADV